MSKAKVISVLNHKGGVGKTTTTINLGGALRQKGYKVLLIDLDGQANLTESLGFSAELPQTIYGAMNRCARTASRADRRYTWPSASRSAACRTPTPSCACGPVRAVREGSCASQAPCRHRKLLRRTCGRFSILVLCIFPLS